MGKLNLSRRAFAKLAAMTTAAAAVAGSVAPGVALAEDEEASTRGSEVKRIRSCCRGCGKMECGVWVTVENGRVVKTEGDQSSFQSSGNHCGKGQASIQAAYHPARIYHPMKRTNPKGEDPGWVRITWDEAMDTIGKKFTEIINEYGGQSIFNMCGTSRQWVYGPYCFYKWLFDTPNAHVASEICKGPRRLMGAITSVDGAPWMALRDGPRVYVQWGTAPENSNYDDSCRNLVDKMAAADVHICIDPRLSGSGKEADYWLNLRPGSDGALALCWQHIILKNDLVDWEFVKRWSNASFLVVEDMEPTGGRYYELFTPMVGSTADSPAPPADVAGTKLKTRLLKESDVVEGGSPRKFYAWNKNANNGQGGLVVWDVDTTQWEGCNHVAPTREQMEVVYEGTSQEGYLPPPVLQRARGGGHRLGYARIPRGDPPRWLEARCQAGLGVLGGVGGRMHPRVVRGDHRPRPGSRGGGLPGLGDAPRGPELRQRRHPPAARPRSDRQLHPVGARHSAPYVHHGQFRRPGGQPWPDPLTTRRAGDGRSWLEYAPGGQGAAYRSGRHSGGGRRA